MYSYARAVLYAIVLWGMVFLATFFVYPLRAENLMLFAVLRMLAQALLSVFLTVMYFRDVEEHLIRDGVKLGILLMTTSIVLDQGPFVWGLMHFSFLNYLTDTGLSYLLYPIVTVGAAFLLSADKNVVEDSEASGYGQKPLSPPLPTSKDTPTKGVSDPKVRV
jgi:EamA domain-containing membrane protein RarD